MDFLVLYNWYNIFCMKNTKKSENCIMGNRTEELFKDFPYGEKIIKLLKAKFADKLKRRVNTAIVLYDFNWGGHFSNHYLSQMREKKTMDIIFFE